MPLLKEHLPVLPIYCPLVCITELSWIMQMKSFQVRLKWKSKSLSKLNAVYMLAAFSPQNHR